MGKGSGKAKMPADTQFDKDLKQQGPAMSDPMGPILQLTQLGGFPGQIDWSQTSLGAQMEGLPPEMLAEIRRTGMPQAAPMPTATAAPMQRGPTQMGALRHMQTKRLGV